MVPSLLIVTPDIPPLFVMAGITSSVKTVDPLYISLEKTLVVVPPRKSLIGVDVKSSSFAINDSKISIITSATSQLDGFKDSQI